MIKPYQKVKIYFASPLGFSKSTEVFMKTLERMLEKCGYEVLNPWNSFNKKKMEKAHGFNLAERKRALQQANMEIGKNNEEAIKQSKLVLAVLDGVDVDSGTASEIGYAYAIGKKVFGLRTDFRQSGENEGCIVNLQVQYWINASGGEIARSLKELKTMIKS